MKEILESLQIIDTKLDDCRFHLTTMNYSEKIEKLFTKLNEASKEVKTLLNKIN